jgi:LacI family transcriptional regulator, galactose operon repressor
MPSKLIDVARNAGVSTATASRVLNNKMVMPIPQHTVDRIRRAARDLHYVPNRFARGLATRRTYTLGFYTQEMTDPHGAVLLDTIEMAARERGYHVLVSARRESVAYAAHVDGLIALRPPDDAATAEPLECPVVYVYPMREAMLNTIGWSDYEAAREAARYLAALGHRHTGGIYGANAGDKEKGFRVGAAEAGMALTELRETGEVLSFPTRAQYNDFFRGSGYQLTRQMLRERPEITAVFARNDVVAAGVLQALRDADVPVPARVSVLSYYDTLLASCVAPPLTSMRTPIEEAGRIAVDRLIDAIESHQSPFPGLLLPTSLVVRGSTGPPAGAMVDGQGSRGDGNGPAHRSSLLDP